MRSHLRMMFIPFLILLLFLSGCTVGSTPSPDQGGGLQNGPGNDDRNLIPVTGGELTIQTLAMPEWDPLKGLSANRHLSSAEGLVYRGLFTYSPEGTWQGDLVDRFTLNESGDQKVLSFSLKKEAKWQDGSPVTFEDVRFTLETYLSPFYYGAWKQDLSYIDGTSTYRSGKAAHISGILQGKTGEIELHMTAPTSSFYEALTAPLLPAKTLQGKKPEEIVQLAKEGKVMGTGPFKPDRLSGEEYHFVRAREEGEGGPYLDRISFRAGGSGKEGSPAADLVELYPGSPQNLAKGKVFAYPAALYDYLGFNLKESSLRSEVRQAIRLSIDQKGLIDKALQGEGVPANSIIPAGFWGFSGGAPQATDVKKAAQIMEGLGYSKEKPLTLTLSYPEEPAIMASLAAELKTMLAPVHIEVVAKPMPKEDFYAALFSGEKMQLFLHAWPYVEDPGLWWKMFGKEHDVDNLGLNVYHFQDQAVSSLLQSIYRTAPSKLTKEKVLEAAQKLDQAGFLIPLVTPVRKYWMSDSLHGVQMDGEGDLLQIESWWKAK